MGLAKNIERDSPWTAVETEPAPFAHVSRSRLTGARLFHSGWMIPGTIVLSGLLEALAFLDLSGDVALGSSHLDATAGGNRGAILLPKKNL